mmetsp:Transcript_49971/g.117474  ORF Transcript_49971/g.117474 Transcript_49971/m.117474 type:complete len:251 (+) Transcript_49971:264-1016(+)
MQCLAVFEVKLRLPRVVKRRSSLVFLELPVGVEQWQLHHVGHRLARSAIEVQHSFEGLNAVRIQWPEHNVRNERVSPGYCWDVAPLQEEVPCPGHSRRGIDEFFGRAANDSNDFLELVSRLLALKEGLAGHELPKNAAGCPNVHFARVGGLQNDLRRPVPPCGYVLSELFIVIHAFRTADTAHAKVTQLELAACVDNAVPWLQVTVDEPSLVKILQRQQNLVRQMENSAARQGLRGPNYPVQVGAHQILR